jgi:ketosteroid isomerase-like protein
MTMKRALYRGVGLIGSILLLSAVGCASPSSNDERSTRLEDLETIRDALQQYAIFLDDGRVDDYVSLYTEDAVFTAADVVYEGRDEIRRELGEKKRRPGKHLTFPAVIEMVSPTEARTYSDFLRIKIAQEGDAVPWLITHVGRYYDVLVKGEDGQWRFSRRDIHLTGGVNRHTLIQPTNPR